MKTSRTLAVWLLLASMLALVGCSGVKVGLGLRTHLDKIPVTSIGVNLAGDPGIAPGEKSGLLATLIGPNGTVLVTEGKGKGRVLWSDLAVTASVVTYKNGAVSLARDPRLSDGRMGHVTVTVPSHPGVRAELDIPLRYDYRFVANFSGSSGSSGLTGASGIDGLMGSPGSFDPDHPAPGGNGGNGTSGSDGQDGGAGGDAPPVAVRATLRAAGSHPLLQVGVTAAGRRERFYLIDPQGGSLTIHSEGGSGGSGGKGGQGGRGGAGGIGIPGGSSGSDGLNGRDGNSGWSGRAGSVTVTYDPQVKPFLAAIRISNAGGPPPVLNEQPVGPLW